MNKNKCWLCSQLPHLAKHERPLSAVPFSGEDICEYLECRQANPVLSRIGGTKGDVSAKVGEITSNWKMEGYKCTDYWHWYYPQYQVKHNFLCTMEKDDHTPQYRTNFASLLKGEEKVTIEGQITGTRINIRI